MARYTPVERRPTARVPGYNSPKLHPVRLRGSPAVSVGARCRGALDVHDPRCQVTVDPAERRSAQGVLDGLGRLDARMVAAEVTLEVDSDEPDERESCH